MKKRRSNIKPGERYGTYTVIARSDELDSGGVKKWICRCDCGNVEHFSRGQLLYNRRLPCPCMNILKKVKKEHSSAEPRIETLCWNCIRSAAPKSLQCEWDATIAEVIPAGAEMYDGKILTCPKYLTMEDEQNMALLRTERAKAKEQHRQEQEYYSSSASAIFHSGTKKESRWLG